VRLIDMRGTDQHQGHVFSYISRSSGTPRSSAAADPHDGRQSTQGTLAGVQQDVFQSGRPSDSPESSCCALCCWQMLYSVRSERLLIEEIDYNILFRWFVGAEFGRCVWDATVFTKNPTVCWRPKWPKSFWRWWWSSRGQGWAGRTLHGGRKFAGSLGQHEEFSAKNKKGSRQ